MIDQAQRHEAVADLFARVCDLPRPDQERVLRWECGSDDDLRCTVERLLRADSGTHGVLDAPVVFAAARTGDTLPELPRGYHADRKLGAGGCGEVWLARQTEPLQRTVAVKVIRRGMDSDAVVARFEQERQALAVMDHPHVAKVLDAGMTNDGRPLFVMEYVPGTPITGFCDEHVLTIRERLELFVRVCHAVQHAHMKGIIHRDIKPSNILVHMRDGEAVPKVIDFGVAKAIDPTLTGTTLFTEQGQLIGTPEYMSPEQAAMGEVDIDTRTDVYSLGVVLYELVSGVLPFDASELRRMGYLSLQQFIRSVEPPSPSRRLSHLPADAARLIGENRRSEPAAIAQQLSRELEWIPLKAMRQDRDHRYPTPIALAEDVQRFLIGAPLVAAPETRTYRLRKLVIRNRRACFAGALLLGTLLLGLAGTMWQARVAMSAEKEQRRLTESERAARDRLRQIADFQGRMLGGVDLNETGQLLTQDIRRQIDAARTRSDGLSGQPVQFEQLWSGVNAVDTATRLIDRSILSPAAHAIGAEFSGQPEIAASLRQVLADRYADMGLLDAAMVQQESALTMRQQVLGEAHPDTLASRASMGALLRSQGKLDAAEAVLRNVLDARISVLGSEHVDTLRSINSLGVILQHRGRFDEATPYLTRALEAQRRVLGPDHPDTLSTMNDLCLLRQQQGQLEDAELIAREVLERRTRVLGRDSADTLISVANLGFILLASGQLEEAEQYQRQAISDFRRVRGENHYDSVTVLANLAILLQTRGKVGEALPMLREVLEKRRHLLGNYHQATIGTIVVLGNCLLEADDVSAAEPFVREALELSRVLAEDNPVRSNVISLQGNFLLAQGKLEEAEVALRDALAVTSRRLPDAHPGVLRKAIDLGVLLVAQHRCEEAIELFGKAEGPARAAFTHGNVTRLARMLMHRGQAQAGIRQCVTALASLEEAYQLFERVLGPAHRDCCTCVEAAVDLLNGWESSEPIDDREGEIARWRHRLQLCDGKQQVPDR